MLAGIVGKILAMDITVHCVPSPLKNDAGAVSMAFIIIPSKLTGTSELTALMGEYHHVYVSELQWLGLSASKVF